MPNDDRVGQSTGNQPTTVSRRRFVQGVTGVGLTAATLAGTPAAGGNDPRPIDVRVVDVRRRPADGDRPPMYMVLLEDERGTQRLPIWVGPSEGVAMALQLEKVEVARPQTYAFVAGLLQASSARLREVRVSRLAEETFYAVAVVEAAGALHHVDARPSDAINLALAIGAPIRVDPAVFEAQAAMLATASEERLRHRQLLEQYSLDGTEGAAEIAASTTARWPSSLRFTPRPAQEG